MPKKQHDVFLSDWQLEVFDSFSEYRFIVVSAGRQSGKTFLGVLLLFMEAVKKRGVNWWVSPTFQNSKVAFRRLIDFLDAEKIIPYKLNRSDLRIEFPNKASIVFKSADREEGLRGETVHFLVIDEMGLVKRDAWLYALRGTITATNAQVLFIGTPKGKNLFYELYTKGQDPEEKEYISFQFESNKSPFFSDAEWEEVKRLPSRIFEQEYQAKFIDDGGEVFRNIKDCVKGTLQLYNPKKNYFAGVDLAKSYDFTVITILDESGHLVAFDRFNDISWTIQKERIIKLCRQYDAYVKLDSTGLGDPILDDLNEAIRVEGFKFSNTSKRQIIEALSMAIERQDISFPEIPELLNELSIFTFEQLQSGMIRYSAPEGLHDDIVISLALAWHAFGGTRSYSDSFADTGERTITI